MNRVLSRCRLRLAVRVAMQTVASLRFLFLVFVLVGLTVPFLVPVSPVRRQVR